MTTDREISKEVRCHQGIRVIYVLLLCVAASIAALSLYLRLFHPTYYAFSIFDPTIGWWGWALSLIAIAPIILGRGPSKRTKLIVPAVCILILAAFQSFILGRSLFAADVPGDFSMNFRGALEIYGKLASPYSISGSVSFPFPTYIIYWFSSLAGRLTISQSFSLFVIANSLIWLSVAALLWKHYKVGEFDPHSRLLFVLLFLNSSAFDAFAGTGQTTVFVSLALAIMLVSFSKAGLRWFLLGGAAAGTAALIKPQVSIVLVGLVVILFHQIWKREQINHLVASLAGAVAAFASLIGISLLFPSGLKLQTYSEFFTSVLPSLSDPGASRVWSTFGIMRGNASPIALIVSGLSGVFGVNPSRLSSIATIAGLLAFSILTFRTSRSRLELAILPWLFAPLFLTQVTWSYSSVWIVPAFLFVFSRQLGSNDRRMPFLFFAGYGLLRVGPNALALMALCILFTLLLQSLSEGVKVDHLRVTPADKLENEFARIA